MTFYNMKKNKIKEKEQEGDEKEAGKLQQNLRELISSLQEVDISASRG